MKKITLNSILNVLLVGAAALLIGRYLYFKPKLINGTKAPEFSALTLSGDQLTLSQLKGRYVLIDFWGSWCGPCRVENPDLVRLYNKYKDVEFKDAEGFEIVSVAIEKDEGRWQRAIQKDGLLWKYHILDLSSSTKFFDSNIAGLYGVKQLPTKYLINEHGVIIGVNQSPEELDRLLAEKIL